ncbi:MAG: glycosyltransferase family 4 protein [Nitrososphaerales archaeon]
MLAQLRICVNSQTPFVKFNLPYKELVEKHGSLDGPVRLEQLEAGKDYQYTPGGVTAMLFPLLNRMRDQNIIQDPIWVSLASNAPAEVDVDHIRLFHVQLPEQDIQRYANFKESIWNEIHGIGRFEIKPEEYEAFIRYNWLSSQVMLKLLRDTDLYFIHDFQQLLTGSLIGPSAPAVLEWHIPFRLELVSPRLKAFVLKNIEGFDSMIVSTRRDLEGLIHAGYRGRAYQIYPYIDAKVWTHPSIEGTEKLQKITQLKPNEKLLLVVARMDSIKAQDMAIMALSHLSKSRNDLKLLLIGNGSYSGSSQGGLALPKSALWKRRLQDLTRSLKLEDKVIFAGYQPDEVIKAAFASTDITLIPSKTEGFGLTTIESWMYRTPVIVSDGAGSSELVVDDVNGYTFKSGNDRELAEKIETMLNSGEKMTKMGEKGFDSAAMCEIDRSISSLKRVFEETLVAYR